MGSCCSCFCRRRASDEVDSAASPKVQDLEAGVRFNMVPPSPRGTGGGGTESDARHNDRLDKSKEITERDDERVGSPGEDEKLMARAPVGMAPVESAGSHLQRPTTATRHVNANNHLTGFRHQGQGNVRIHRSQYDDGDELSPDR